MNVRTSQILIILLSSFLLLSCGTTIKPIDVTVTQVDRAPLILPEVDKINADSVNWFIISEETADDRFMELKEKGYDPVLFGLTDEGYKNLSINTKKLMTIIQQQQEQIDALKQYYEYKEPKDGDTNTDSTD
jgi:hypothetical protein